MNRTQRAIKKQYRETEANDRKIKNQEREKVQLMTSNPNSLIDRKGNAAKNVVIFSKREKDNRKITRDYKNRVLSEKKMKKELARV